MDTTMEMQPVEHSKDQDQDLNFQLRGDSINALIDAATPLLGMVVQAKELTDVEDDVIDAMHTQAVNEIDTIVTELKQEKYEPAVILAFSYILCTYIDEAMLSTSWGTSSVWLSSSLLVHYHKESWGGEKVFDILSRLEKDPERYKDLLEFIFLCFNLGFQGRYANRKDGHDEYKKVIHKLYETLKRLEDTDPDLLSSHTGDHVVSTRYKLSKQLPIWGVFAGFFGFLAVIFIGYSLILHSQSSDVLEHLEQILK